MGLALALSEYLGSRPTSLQFEPAWRASAQEPDSLKWVAATGREKSELFVHDASGAVVLDAATGKRLFERRLGAGSGSTLGDVDGDGRLELLLFERAGTAVVVEAWRLSAQQKLWSVTLPLSGEFERAVAVRLDATRRAGAVLRSGSGQLMAIGPDGQKRWEQQSTQGELVSLDTVSASGNELVLCALKNQASVLDATGVMRWTRVSGSGLRRARSLEPVAGESVVVLGEENGAVTALAGADGAELWSKNLGQPPTELRLAEVDGNPASLEFVVGGKKGGLWVFSRTGSELFSSTTGVGKISEISSFLPDGAAAESLLVAGSEGNLVLVSPQGKRVGAQHFSGAIERMVAGPLGGGTKVFVATSSELVANSVVAYEAPAFYSLLAAGAMGCVVVALVGFLVGRSRPPEPVRMAAEQMTIEAQKARKIMLRESLRELYQLGPQLSHVDLVQRLRELREQLADADRRLLELGASLEPEIFRCKQCGGPLEIGAEQCDYCGVAVVA